MNCPRCQQPLQSPSKDVSNKKCLLICSADDHYFVFNNKDNYWLLRIPHNNLFAYVGYDGNYFTMVVKGPNETPIINMVEPFKIEESSNLLNRYVKLLVLL